MKKTISLVIALLIIQIPIALAQQLTITRFSGQNQAEGFAKPHDTLTIEADAEMTDQPAETLAKTRLKTSAGGGPSVPFDSCVKKQGAEYHCVFTTSNVVFGGRETYKITLFDGTGTTLATQEKTLTIDRIPPKVKELEILPNETKDPQVNIRYKAEDYASTEGDTNTCSGIKKIEFFHAGRVAAQDTGDTGRCSQENIVAFSPRTTSSYEEVRLCAKATDFVEQASRQECKTLLVDKSAPSVESVEFKDENGETIKGIKTGQQLNTDVYIKITGQGDVVESSVTADFSSLSPGRTGAFNEKEGDTFIWRGVPVTNPNQCNVKVTVADRLGNKGDRTVACTLPVDDEGPTAREIKTEGQDTDGTALLPIKGKITVKYTEPGAGLKKREVFMDLSSIGLSAEARANSCLNKSASEWECSWGAEPRVPTGSYTLRTSGRTRDDIGNPITNTLELRVKVDKTPPRILSPIDLQIRTPAGEEGGLPLRGSTVEFKIKATDFAEAKANFTAIGGNEAQDGLCSGEKDKECEFATTIASSGPLTAKLSFGFIDPARNTAEAKMDLFVFGIRNESRPNFWTNQVKCSPELIDRSTTSLINHQVYCTVQLHSPNSKAKTAGILKPDISECSGEVASHIADIGLLNGVQGTKTPVLVFTLATTDFAINELNLSCPIKIFTKIDNFATEVPEHEDVNITLQFYNLPLGELASNINEEVKDSVKDAESFLKIIGDLDKFIGYAEKTCTWKNVITNLMTALDLVLTIIPIVQLVKKGTDMSRSNYFGGIYHSVCQERGYVEEFLFGEEGKPGESGVGKFTGGYGDSLWNFLEETCNFVNCASSFKEGQSPLENNKGVTGENAIGSLKYLGGAVPWCNEGFGEPETLPAVQKALGGAAWASRGFDLSSDIEQKSYQGGSKETARTANIKDSLVLSTTCLCVPGIVHNLQKMRQIKCKKALCLARDVKEKGIPSSYCRDEAAYLTCNYVVGEIFNLLPFNSLVSGTLNMIKEALSSPFDAIRATMAVLCRAIDGADPCQKAKDVGDDLEAVPFEAKHLVCIIPKTLAKVGDAIANIQVAKSMSDKENWKVGDAYCDQLNKFNPKEGER